MEKQSSPLEQVGKAFSQAIKVDPAAQDAVERWQSQIQALAALVGSKQYQGELEQARAEWEATYGEHEPQTLEDWAELATRAGLDPNMILKGDWIPGSVAPIIQGYLARRKDDLAMARQPSTQADGKLEAEQVGARRHAHTV